MILSALARPAMTGPGRPDDWRMHMFRKILTLILVLAAVAAVPVVMSGCGPKEYTHRSEYQEDNKPVHQDTVVD